MGIFCFKKKFNRLVAGIITVFFVINSCVNVFAAGEKPNLQLNALSACVIDAENGRVLYGKNELEVRAMASTTKIMTLIVTLENANLSDIVTVSQNAAKQPDVQLNINTGEQYVLGDLVYSLMLESHNDVAVAIAEHVGGSVEGFADMMNAKAAELSMNDTYFITPNGLDAVNDKGKHSSTAVDMAHLAAYAIKNEKFLEITNTKTYSFNEVNGKRGFTVNNKNQFLNMMDGAIGVKTGFTNDAGYCFVGALKQNGRTFVTVVLGSGWPPNKTFKWKDTRALMQFGIDNYFPEVIYDEEFSDEAEVIGGKESVVRLTALGKVSMLLSQYDDVDVIYEYRKKLNAPIMAGEEVGNIFITVNDEIVEVLQIVAENEVKATDFEYFLDFVVEEFLLF